MRSWTFATLLTVRGAVLGLRVVVREARIARGTFQQRVVFLLGLALALAALLTRGGQVLNQTRTSNARPKTTGSSTMRCAPGGIHDTKTPPTSRMDS